MNIIKKLILLFLLLLLSASPAFAQTTSLSIWPPLLETTIKPGKAITQVYKLKNTGDNTNITAKIVPFSPSDELGHIKLLNSEPPPFFSLQNADLKIPSTFKLKSGQTQDLVLKIRIPEDTDNADYYLTFLFESNTQHLIGGSGSKANAKIGANILLTISSDGNPTRTAKIQQFTIKTFLDSFSPISFLLKVKNTSKTHFKAIGHIDIKNTFNKKVSTLALREDNILANSIRQLITNKTWNPIFPIGRYTATATITPQNTPNTISQTITFYILPYKLILIITLLFLLYKIKKHFFPQTRFRTR